MGPSVLERREGLQRGHQTAHPLPDVNPDPDQGAVSPGLRDMP